MKCPKCGYHSFDYLDCCKKCGGDLREQKGRFGLRGSIFTGRERQGAEVAPPATATNSPDQRPAPSTVHPEPEGKTAVSNLPTQSGLLAVEEIALPEPVRGDSVSPARSQPEFPLEDSPPDRDSAAVPPDDPELELDLAGRFFNSLAFGDEGPPAGSSNSQEMLFPPADWLSAAADLPEVAEIRNAVDQPAAEISCIEEVSEGAEEKKILPSPGVPPIRRLAAGGIDLLILGMACILFMLTGEILFLPAAEVGRLFDFSHLLELAIPYYLIFFSLSFGYFTLFHYLTGQTPGKMLLRLRVEAADGSGLVLSQAFLRSVGGLASLLTVGIGYWRIYFDPEGRGWNDLLAGSRVVPVSCPR